MTEVARRFDEEIKSICTRFNGGLSNTSTKKFDELIKIVSEIVGVEEDDIYITAATSRASNLWNRLAQGKPLTQHFKFALGIIDSNDLQGGLSPATKFIGPGVGHYDAIALVIRKNGNWVIAAVLESNHLSVYDNIKAAFPNEDISRDHQDFNDNAANTDTDIEEAIKKCWEDKSFDYVDVEPLYAEFQARFGKEAIKSLNGIDVLTTLFGKKEDNSLVYCLEHVKKFQYFGGITGWRTIYTLYEKDGEWKYGTSASKIRIVSKSEAIDIATEYRDKFVALFEKLDNMVANAEIDDQQSFTSLQQIIKDILGDILYNRNWVWKYLHMIYPEIFMNVFTFEWVSKIFRVACIIPGSTYTIQCGQFSLFAKKLGIKNVYLYHILRSLDDAEYQPIEEDNVSAEDGSDIIKTMDDMYPSRTERPDKKIKLNIILYGAPGTGKTYSTVNYALKIADPSYSEEWDRKATMSAYKQKVEEGFITFTTFHQSYGYEDFIQGLRPVTVKGNMELKPVDGVFKTISDRAAKDFDNNYVIIIDEINRANISKVLGELITLIEEDKRWGELNEMSVTLPSGDFFAVPNNLYIIGTMNTADKSISLIDTALRRRFAFVEVTPELSLIEDDALRGVLERLNKSLEQELESTDLLVGHAYFMGATLDSFADIMNQSIIPLLYEYFYDNRKAVEKQVKCAIGDLPYEIQKGTMGRIKIVKKAD